MHVESLHIYPLKSAGVVDREAARIGADGLEGDRRWMVVTPGPTAGGGPAAGEGIFLTQREHPALAALRVENAEGDAITLSMRGRTRTLRAGAGRATPERMEVRVWRSTVSAARVSVEDDAWLSEALGLDVQLVRFDDASQRRTNEAFADAPVTFADGYPVLIATRASLAALNATIRTAGGTAVPMRRFRPNIVLDGEDAWAEDGWARLRVGDTTLDLVKPCARCTITSVDQETGEDRGEAVLNALRQTRFSLDRSVPGVMFGWNAVLSGPPATLRVGDGVEVLERREPWAIRPAA